MNTQRIQASDEAWEDRSLGSNENFVKVIDVSQEASIEEASGTQMISIRLQKSLIDDFKMIATLNGGIGYQTLMKQIMQRFVDSEKKRIFNELVAEKIKMQQQGVNPVKKITAPETHRKAA